MKLGRDYYDIIGGALLIASGLWFMSHAMENYSIGTLRRMGPGFFPATLGGLVAAFGVIVLIPALFRRTENPPFDLRPFILICAGLASFALVVERLGLVPAVVVLTFFASYARAGSKLWETAILAVGLSITAVAIFIWGLGIPVQPFRWNF